MSQYLVPYEQGRSLDSREDYSVAEVAKNIKDGFIAFLITLFIGFVLFLGFIFYSLCKALWEGFLDVLPVIVGVFLGCVYLAFFPF